MNASLAVMFLTLSLSSCASTPAGLIYGAKDAYDANQKDQADSAEMLARPSPTPTPAPVVTGYVRPEDRTGATDSLNGIQTDWRTNTEENLCGNMDFLKKLSDSMTATEQSDRDSGTVNLYEKRVFWQRFRPYALVVAGQIKALNDDKVDTTEVLEKCDIDRSTDADLSNLTKRIKKLNLKKADVARAAKRIENGE